MIVEHYIAGLILGHTTIPVCMAYKEPNVEHFVSFAYGHGGFYTTWYKTIQQTRDKLYSYFKQMLTFEKRTAQ